MTQDINASCLCGECASDSDNCEGKLQGDCLCDGCAVETDINEDAPYPCEYIECLSCDNSDYFKGKHCDTCLTKYTPEGREQLAHLYQQHSNQIPERGFISHLFVCICNPSQFHAPSHPDYEKQFEEVKQAHTRPEPQKSSSLLGWF